MPYCFSPLHLSPGAQCLAVPLSVKSKQGRELSSVSTILPVSLPPDSSLSTSGQLTQPWWVKGSHGGAFQTHASLVFDSFLRVNSPSSSYPPQLPPPTLNTPIPIPSSPPHSSSPALSLVTHAAQLMPPVRISSGAVALTLCRWPQLCWWVQWSCHTQQTALLRGLRRIARVRCPIPWTSYMWQYVFHGTNIKIIASYDAYSEVNPLPSAILGRAMETYSKNKSHGFSEKLRS